MLALINRGGRRVNNVLAISAWLLLFSCLAFNIYLARATPNPGFVFDARWRVINVDDCDDGPEACPDATTLQVGDVLQSIGSLTFQQFSTDPDQSPFQGYLPGDIVQLTVLRDGQPLQVEWHMQAANPAVIIRTTLVSLLVYGSFWVAGTFVLNYMRPADSTWLLLIGLFYLATGWLAVGLTIQSNVANALLILRVIGWAMVPVMVHLHLIVPGPYLNPRLRAPVAFMYAASLVLLLLQIGGYLPWFAYLAGVLLAAMFSIGLLAYRALSPRSPADKLVVRLMLAGIILALVPGLILSVVPALLNISGANTFGLALATLALPMLPFFYTYAIYKHQLGARERRVNRLLGQYALFLIYFILLALVFIIMSRWLWTANSVLAIVMLVVLSLSVALLPIRRPVHSVFDRLTYGTRYSHREILARYADLIPAAIDPQELVSSLKYELAPELEIRQSALLVRQAEQVVTLYNQGVGHEEVPATWSEVTTVLQNTVNYMIDSGLGEHVPHSKWAWIRLALPLRVKERVTGAWLFGHRETNDIYSQEDVDLLERLSGLVSVTLESSQLLDTLTKELENRKLAEAKLAHQSHRLSLLHEIDQAVLAANSPAEIARSAFSWLRQLVPCVRVSVFLFDPEREMLTILAAQGSGKDLITDNDTIPYAAVPALARLVEGELYLEDDVAQKADVSIMARTLAQAGVRAVVSAPLMVAGSVFGALSVANDRPASYTSEHIAIIEEVAKSTALAIHSARLRERVNKSSQELRVLSARLINAQEIERKRLSHELHDEIGQLLTAISLNLAAIERELPVDSNDALRATLDDANELVVGLTNQVRSLSLELRPSMLHDLGLTSTLRWYVTNYARRNEAEVHCETHGLPDRLPETTEITVYRVVQEALTNASRHASATQVDLTVSRLDSCIQVTVEDNGRGFDIEAISGAEPASTGIGLAMMRERIAAVDGQIDIDTAPGKGTRIMATIPFEEQA